MSSPVDGVRDLHDALPDEGAMLVPVRALKQMSAAVLEGNDAEAAASARAMLTQLSKACVCDRQDASGERECAQECLLRLG